MRRSLPTASHRSGMGAFNRLRSDSSAAAGHPVRELPGEEREASDVRKEARAARSPMRSSKRAQTLVIGLSYRREAGARKSALEAAGRDAKAKAETLAALRKKQLGETLAISEEIVASTASTPLLAQMPWR